MNEAPAFIFVEAPIPVEDLTSLVIDPTITIEEVPSTFSLLVSILPTEAFSMVEIDFESYASSFERPLHTPSTFSLPVSILLTEVSSIVEIDFKSYASSVERPSHTPSTAIPVEEVLSDPVPLRPRSEFETEVEALAPLGKRSKTKGELGGPNVEAVEGELSLETMRRNTTILERLKTFNEYYAEAHNAALSYKEIIEKLNA